MTTAIRMALAAAVLASGCSFSQSPSERRATPPSGRDVESFLADFERGIAEGDWRDLRYLFLPSATVVLSERGSDGERYSAEEWLDALPAVAARRGYRRSRRITSIERDTRNGRTLVRSRLSETRIVDDALQETRSEEWMWIVWTDGALRIGALGLEVERERRLAPL